MNGWSDRGEMGGSGGEDQEGREESRSLVLSQQKQLHVRIMWHQNLECREKISQRSTRWRLYGIWRVRLTRVQSLGCFSVSFLFVQYISSNTTVQNM